MKLLITSPDALVDSTKGKYFTGIDRTLDYFLDQDDNNKVVTTSIHNDKLESIHKRFNPILIPKNWRGSPKLIEKIKVTFGIDYENIIILGAKDHDFFQAANSKLLLLSAIYAKKNNPEEKIFSHQYGIPIQGADNLHLFFERFANIEDPWYYHLNVSDKTTLYALTNANTYFQSKDIVELNEKFSECLKEGKSEYRDPFLVYFLVSVYKIFQEISKVDYWGIYPTSNGGPNPDLEIFVRKAREAFKGQPIENLLIRKNKARKRHREMSSFERIKNGCNEQFETIVLNSEYEKKLKNKTVYIIDDYTNYGASCETARHLFEKAGVSKLIFIAMGKFGKSYSRYKYNIEGNVFEEYKFQQLGREEITGTFNAGSNSEFLDSIKGLI